MTSGAASGWMLSAFGKVGLLIDDASFARSRVARELYGADELPSWWVCVSTIEDGLAELAALIAQLDALGTQHDAALVVVDRALPVRRAEVPRYWDDPTGSLLPGAWQPPLSREDGFLLDEFRKRIDEVRTPQRSSVRVLMVTSYPQLDEAGSWIARFHQPLFQRRRDSDLLWPGDAAPFSLDPFLRFRPESYAPIASADAAALDADAAGGARYLAKCAGELLDELARALASADSFRVLMTGAGMSQSSGFEHPGMPRNDWLLARAAWMTLCRRDERLKEKLPWREPPARSDEPWPQLPLDPEIKADPSPIAGCIAEYFRCGKVTVKTGAFNELFSNRPGKLEREFRKHLRASILRYDEGITYRHWLAARLPFDLRFTTNFDGFHQRAGAYWASRSGQDPVPVLSVYGGAATESNLAFSSEEFERAVGQVARAMRANDSKRRVVVVVVGYAFCDAELPRALAAALGDRGTLYWVAPEAYRVLRGLRAKSEATDAALPVASARALQKLLGGKRERIVAVPMRAVDFFYDLWETYKKG